MEFFVSIPYCCTKNEILNAFASKWLRLFSWTCQKLKRKFITLTRSHAHWYMQMRHVFFFLQRFVVSECTRRFPFISSVVDCLWSLCISCKALLCSDSFFLVAFQFALTFMENISIFCFIFRLHESQVMSCRSKVEEKWSNFQFSLFSCCSKFNCSA